MHALAYVFVDPTEDLEIAVADKMYPFDDALQVERYRVNLSMEDVFSYLIEYSDIQVGDPNFDIHNIDVVKALREYFVADDEEYLYWDEREQHFYYYSTLNPNGMYDWYDLGGRWSNTHGITVTHEEAIAHPPSAIVVDEDFIETPPTNEYINIVNQHHHNTIAVVDYHF